MDRWEYFLGWTAAVLSWSVFVIGLITMTLWLNVILYEHWTRVQRLRFPVVQIPLALTERPFRWHRDLLFWLGFGAAAAVTFWNGLQSFHPDLPLIPVKYGHNPMIFEGTSLRGWVSLYPFIVGLALMLPQELLLSCCVFFVLTRLVMAGGEHFGASAFPGFPFAYDQAFGAYVGLGAGALWTARKTLGAAFLPSRESGRRFPGRPACCFLLLFALVTGFGILAGMSPGISFAFFVLWILLSVGITRIRAELGAPFHDIHSSGPDTFLIKGSGTEEMTDKSLSGLSLFAWFNRVYRSHPMPVQMECLHFSAQPTVSRKRLIAALLIAGAVGTLAAFWALSHAFYEYGITSRMFIHAAKKHGPEPFRRLQSWIATGQEPQTAAIIATSIGFLAVFGFWRLHYLLPMLPLHPVGYAIANSFSMKILWLPVCLAWMGKAMALRIGSASTVKRIFPFALGLVLGDFVIGGSWIILGLILDKSTYSFWQ